MPSKLIETPLAGLMSQVGQVGCVVDVNPRAGFRFEHFVGMGQSQPTYLATCLPRAEVRRVRAELGLLSQPEKRVARATPATTRAVPHMYVCVWLGPSQQARDRRIQCGNGQDMANLPLGQPFC